MRSPMSVKGLEDLGRVRLSPSFFLRDFLFSEIASIHGLANVPEDPDLAIKAGTRLCEELLEPLNASFGRIAIRSAYRSPTVNAFGNENGYACARNEANYAEHLAKLTDALRQARQPWVGEPLYARYDPPITPWFLRRNEIWLALP